QKAHPFGAKLVGRMRISATNASLMVVSYVWLGKTPNNEMMKFIQRYGWKLLCGWLPPAGEIDCGAIATDGATLRYGKNVDACATTLLPGFASLAVLVEPRNAWLCVGIC